MFRLECLETLNWPPCAPIPFHITKQNPSAEFYNVADNLDSLLQPIDAPANIIAQVDSNGKIIGFVENERIIVGSANTSMSINRAPYKQRSLHTTAGNSIKGSPGNVPFLPGFLEELDDLLAGETTAKSTSGEESKFLSFKDDATLLNTIPTIGQIVLPNHSSVKKPAETPKSINIEEMDMFDLLDMVTSNEYIIHTVAAPVKKSESIESEETPEDDKKVSENEIDEIEIPIIPGNTEKVIEIFGAATEPTKEKFEFAQRLVLSADEEDEYKRLVPTMARKYPFSLDPFQQSSVLCMERGESLFVAAHTSAGKTVVAEYAIALCQAHKTRAVYTSPIKALSNQKFRDFKQIFGDVGLVTGDIQLHPEAACLIMTTEILRSMLYNGSEVIRDLEWVVFDEVHYINNEERGHVWEEVLIMLPAHVKIVMLSATVPNCVEFADWVGRIKNRKINVISTDRRPVPLEHFLYTGQDGKTQKDLFKIIDRSGQFILKGYNDAKDSKAKIYEKEKAGGAGGRGTQRGGGRGGGGNGGGRNWPGKNDKNIYLNLINYMKCSDQLPMVVFVFSRKRCDENAQMLASMNLTTEVEKQHVRLFFSQCVQRLKGSDKELPQVLTMRDLCLRGFAVHHSGILPILKEVVELLFQKGYVKILFATETFAMGVNMPARCVVFDSIMKHDGTERRMLNPGEYTQMAGRAGRRGLDLTGTVIIICKDSTVPQPDVLKNLISGQALRLESKFRVTYSMILNLLRVEQLKIEDMLQRSYVESDSLRESKEKRKSLVDTKNAIQTMSTIECSTCSPNSQLRDYHDALAVFLRKSEHIWPKLNDENVINKLLCSGRFLIVNSAQQQLQNECVLLIKELNNKTLQILVASADADETTNKNAAAIGFSKLPKSELSWLTEENSLLSTSKFGTRGAAHCSTNIRSFRLCEIPLSGIVAVMKKCAKGVQSGEILQEYNMTQIPRFRDRELSENVKKLLQQITTAVPGLKSGEIETYTWKELGSFCQNLDTSFDTDLLEKLEYNLNLPQSFPARHCTRFDEHFSVLRDRIRIERKIESLEYELSSDALLLSEEYHNRLKVLEALNFVEQKMVSLKGRIGCEIHHQELLITELILDYKFHQRSPAELAALLSTLTCQYNSGREMQFGGDTVFGEISESVKSVLTRLESVASKHKSQISDLGCEIRFDLMEVVYEWANGTPFYQIMEMTDCQEGLIVKCIQRLDEVCKDVRNAGRIVGDPALVEKMEEVSASIRRDIVFAASLYTTV